MAIVGNPHFEFSVSSSNWTWPEPHSERRNAAALTAG